VGIPTQTVVVAIGAFAAALAFVAQSLGLVKALVDAGFLKKRFFLELDENLARHI